VSLRRRTDRVGPLTLDYGSKVDYSNWKGVSWTHMQFG
jgi:hypothetical protein